MTNIYIAEKGFLFCQVRDESGVSYWCKLWYCRSKTTVSCYPLRFPIRVYSISQKFCHLKLLIPNENQNQNNIWSVLYRWLYSESEASNLLFQGFCSLLVSCLILALWMVWRFLFCLISAIYCYSCLSLEQLIGITVLKRILIFNA